MALHTDQGRPHVHVVVKAVSERAARLNIYKATLREWRRDFARYLREFGVEANTTERAVGRRIRTVRQESIERLTRGESRFVRERAEAVARELRIGDPRPEPGRSRLLQTRREVEHGWLAFAYAATCDGMWDVADQARRFVDRMTECLPSALTASRWLRTSVQRHVSERHRHAEPWQILDDPWASVSGGSVMPLAAAQP